ncbi:unnamed protein product [Trichogramma brassicae]|uniref:Uncharacterized protein n=1 Tax=Trichogramma brassicae TaxID=86971 RepID=A0A6H5J1E6_9HYME|nr:unnamed protein product [Trichogramma brassicae]
MAIRHEKHRKCAYMIFITSYLPQPPDTCDTNPCERPHMAVNLQELSSLDKLKNLRDSVDWSTEDERVSFHQRLGDLFDEWKDPLPNLRDVFPNEEIDWLLSRSVERTGQARCGGARFIEFVARTGYKDEPEKDEAAGEASSLPRRTTALHRAARRGFYDEDTAMFGELFKIYHRLEVNYVDEFGLTHFHVACRYGLKDVVEEFLRLGQVDPNQAWPDTGDTPLHLALRHKHKEVAESLLRSGADPNATDKHGTTALHVIFERPKDDSMMEFLRMLFEVNDQVGRSVQIDARDKMGWSALHYALRFNNRKSAELLLKRGADPNSAITYGSKWTPLHLIGGYTDDDDLAKMFFEVCDELELTVRVNARSKSGTTPLHEALRRSKGVNRKLVELLLRRGADPNLAEETTDSSPLHIICERGSNDEMLEVLKTFLETSREMKRRLRIDAVDQKGRTALHLALANGCSSMAESLLTRGADQNIVDANGWSPLHAVCNRSFEEADRYGGSAVRFLEICRDLEKPLRVDARDNEGITPLHLALENLKGQAVLSLLSMGADPNLANPRGETPLHVICRTGGIAESFGERFFQRLFEITDGMRRVVQLEARDESGKTPLHLALSYGDEELIGWLLRRGADPNSANANGSTPLQLAVANLQPDTVDLLLDNGADPSRFAFPAASRMCLFMGHGLWAASGALACCWRLEARGYELRRSDAWNVAQFFIERHLLLNPMTDDPRGSLRDDATTTFATEAEETMFAPNLSLRDLIEMPILEATKLLSHEACSRFLRANGPRRLSDGHRGLFIRSLCEIAEASVKTTCPPAAYSGVNSTARCAQLRNFDYSTGGSLKAIRKPVAIPPLALLADERSRLYRRRHEDARAEERQETLRRWQSRWDRSTKGRWTHKLIPNIGLWIDRRHGEVDYHLTQLLTGHGYFKHHSQRYDHNASADCPACPYTVENAKHVFFNCPRFEEERERLHRQLQEVARPENIVQLMLADEKNWLAVASFAHSVIVRLRAEEMAGRR